MKLMQRIMSRSLLLILILVAGIAYYYRDQLFPGQQGRQLAEASSEEHEAGNSAGTGVTDSKQARDGSVSSESAAGVRSGDSARQHAGTDSDETGPSTTGDSTGSSQQSDVLADVQPPALQPGDGRYDETGSEPDRGSAKQGTAAAGSSEPGATSDASAPAPVYRSDEASGNEADVENLLRRARTAYWSGDTEGAESAYRRVLQTDRNDPDPAGELGNMLYAQGDYTGAAEAYYQAALRLLKQGENGRARHLARVIEGLDSDKAAELEEKLNENSAGEAGDGR